MLNFTSSDGTISAVAYFNPVNSYTPDHLANVRFNPTNSDLEWHSNDYGWAPIPEINIDVKLSVNVCELLDWTEDLRRTINSCKSNNGYGLADIIAAVRTDADIPEPLQKSALVQAIEYAKQSHNELAEQARVLQLTLEKHQQTIEQLTTAIMLSGEYK